MATLSPRERDALRLVGDGLSNRAVGEKLGITESTVKQHLQRAYRKLGVRTRTQVLCCYPEITAGYGRSAAGPGSAGLGEAGGT
jgi:DNA-binding CsgD family transcriptional regulator